MKILQFPKPKKENYSNHSEFNRIIECYYVRKELRIVGNLDNTIIVYGKHDVLGCTFIQLYIDYTFKIFKIDFTGKDESEVANKKVFVSTR